MPSLIIYSSIIDYSNLPEIETPVLFLIITQTLANIINCRLFTFLQWKHSLWEFKADGFLIHL